MNRGWCGLLAICTLGFAVAGCAGGGGGQLSQAAYKSRLAEIAKEVDAAQGSLSRDARSATTIAQVQAVLGRYAAAEQRIGDEVAKLKPPTNAASANADLSSGERDDAAEIQALIPKLVKLRSVREAFAFLQSLPHTKGGVEQDKALQELKKLGYTVGS